MELNYLLDLFGISLTFWYFLLSAWFRIFHSSASLSFYLTFFPVFSYSLYCESSWVSQWEVSSSIDVLAKVMISVRSLAESSSILIWVLCLFMMLLHYYLQKWWTGNDKYHYLQSLPHDNHNYVVYFPNIYDLHFTHYRYNQGFTI